MGDQTAVSKSGYPARPFEDRFWEKVDKNGPLCERLGTHCWIWTRATLPRGYGVFTDGSKKGYGSLAHRIAYQLLIGPIPDGKELDHRCHNPPCVNPAHLRPATHKQNHENRSGTQGASGIRGVYYLAKRGYWCARVKHKGRYHTAGWHKTKEAAEAAVIAKRNELFTHNDLDRTRP